MVVWNKEWCKYREATEPNPDSNMEMFTRRGLAEGAVPPEYMVKYGTTDAQLQLVRTLDFHFDNFKRISKLDLKNINPVAVVLNLLPEGWDAKVWKAIDDENGLILITHSQGMN
jgi:hypothetical protein